LNVGRSPSTPIDNRKSEIENPPIPPLSTLLLSAEDDLHDTIFPRLAAAGADLDCIHPFRCLDSHQQKHEPFSLKTDIDELGFEIETTNSDLIIIDPITSFMAGIDHNSTAAIRQYLTPLAQLAAFYGVAILAITHLNKSGRQRDLYRASGSLALAAIARSVHLVTYDPIHNHCLLSPAKTNLTAALAPLPYRIADGKIAWLSTPSTPSTVSTASDAAPEPADFTPEFYRQHDTVTAREFLRLTLAAGPQPAVPLIRQAKSLAIGERTLRRAKAQLAIRSEKDPTRDGPWCWLLPEQSFPPPAPRHETPVAP